MKEVRTQKKYKCDFCKRRSIKSAMERHEKVCFRNPNRYCELCENKGFTVEWENAGEIRIEIPCPYCSKFSAEKKAAIEKWEQENDTRSTAYSNEPQDVIGVPF